MHSLKRTNRLWSTKYRIIWCILYRKICHKIAFLRVFMTIVVRQILPFVVRQKVFMVKSPEIYRMKNTTVFFINSHSFVVRQKSCDFTMNTFIAWNLSQKLCCKYLVKYIYYIKSNYYWWKQWFCRPIQQNIKHFEAKITEPSAVVWSSSPWTVFSHFCCTTTTMNGPLMSKAIICLPFWFIYSIRSEYEWIESTLNIFSMLPEAKYY